jgi:hypothetical protein
MTTTLASPTTLAPRGPRPRWYAPGPASGSAATPVSTSRTSTTSAGSVDPAPIPEPVGASSQAPGGRPPARVRVSAAHLAAPHWYFPALVAAARAMLGKAEDPDGSGGRARVLKVDLTGVPPVGNCAELVLLVNLLRRACGPGLTIKLVGVTPALAAPLISGGVGDDDVVVVDTRGRWWSGRPDLVQPTGTWP